MVSSATELEEAAGVLRTSTPFDWAYSTSMLSSPTPPRMTSFRLAAWSIRGACTFVRLRTTSAS